MLLRAVLVHRNRRQLLLIGITNYDADCLGQPAILPETLDPVNREVRIRVKCVYVYGDRDLLCTCQPLESYVDAAD
jgi:hypothetical protein